MWIKLVENIKSSRGQTFEPGAQGRNRA